ncbi:unnamed protein product [Adineta steineri]|uniref:Uncharacterized protein n=1 Tax=Adineta steineri TaxID=433720 RepID=A0A814HDJ4_9BILA|nr:unnamed protein product [Adineta steineri]CAF1009428.1 unnamed protein product [Adineta steineri]CAF3557283.1 unnamed protein product [Adineta steineri]CAF4080966.1 unnamed protein product [Adineta steineri]
MSIDTGYIIIWLDAHIGAEKNCQEMKKEFQHGLAEAAAVPPDLIDALICDISKCGAPIEFAQTNEDALNLIENNLACSKKIIFISSASLGREIIPEIQKKKLHIESYYIFCGNMTLHLGWGEDLINDGLVVQMFDHEVTLLTRLCRDMSNILIEDGKTSLSQKEPEIALAYFQYAYDLADKAVEYDKPKDLKDPNVLHLPSTAYRGILDSLINTAKQALQ